MCMRVAGVAQFLHFCLSGKGDREEVFVFVPPPANASLPCSGPFSIHTHQCQQLPTAPKNQRSTWIDLDTSTHPQLFPTSCPHTLKIYDTPTAAHGSRKRASEWREHCRRRHHHHRPRGFLSFSVFTTRARCMLCFSTRYGRLRKKYRRKTRRQKKGC